MLDTRGANKERQSVNNKNADVKKGGLSANASMLTNPERYLGS